MKRFLHSKIIIVLTATLIIICIIIIGVFATLTGFRTYNQINANVDRELYLSIGLIDSVVDDAYHAKINGPNAVSDSEFMRYVTEFDDICLKYDLEYLWSLTEDNQGVLRFTTATSKDKIKHEGSAKFYERHSNPDAYWLAFNTMEKQYGTISDEWGDVRVLLVTRVTDNGVKYCLGASKTVDSVGDIIKSGMGTILITSIILILFAVLFALIFTKKLLKPLENMIEVMSSVSTGEEGKTILVEGLYEQRQLANNFNKMSLAIQNKIEDINQLNQHLDITFDAIGDGVIMTDNSGIITRLNNEAQHITGWTQEEALGKDFEEVFYIINNKTGEICMNPVASVLSNGKTISLEDGTVLVCKDGTEKIISDSVAPIKDKNFKIQGTVLVFRDNTSEYTRIEQIEYISIHDSLTGLYNRYYFEKEKNRLDDAMYLPLSIVVADVNGLKSINDIFGHAEGDEVLKDIAKMIEFNFRDNDITARWGGDEFAVLLPNTTSEECEIICNRINNYKFTKQKSAVKHSVSLGHATKIEMDEDINQVLKASEEEMYRHKLQESDSIRNNIITSLERTLSEKYYETELHAKNLGDICTRLGEKLNMKKQEIDKMTLAARLHDIGKIAISESIILKEGKLTDEEWEVIKQHSEIGYRIANSIPAISHIAKGILHHHERYDGNGYPAGLKGKDIPKISRIITIVDSYDVMLSKRPYKEPMSQNEAMDELIRCSGKQFDPSFVKIFIEMMHEDNADRLINDE